MAATVLTLRETEIFYLSDEEFRLLVDKEIRREHPDTTVPERQLLEKVAPQLRYPENLDRWYSMLVEMKKSVETQLGARRSDVRKLYGTLDPKKYDERLRTFQRWRGGTLRFLNGVEERLSECRRLRGVEFGGKLPRILEVLQERITETAVAYEAAISDHKRRTLADDLEPSEFDQLLWSTLNGNGKK